MKVFEDYDLECLCEYRVYTVVYSRPNYGGDYYRGDIRKVEGVLQMNSSHCILRYLSFI